MHAFHVYIYDTYINFVKIKVWHTSMDHLDKKNIWNFMYGIGVWYTIVRGSFSVSETRRGHANVPACIIYLPTRSF